jgi:hypothetical protein
MEAAKVEQCSECNSFRLKNNVYVRTGRPTTVYVECADCGAFIAKYVLSSYTTDAKFSSMLETIFRERWASAKRISHAIRVFSKEVEREFERVKQLVREHPAHDIPTMIEELEEKMTTEDERQEIE